MSSRKSLDAFAALKPLLSGIVRAPLAPVFLVTGDDEWVVGEAAKRLTAAFRGAFVEGEVSTYAAPNANVKEAVADAATVALFSTNRLVVLEVTDLLRGGKVTAEEIDSLLDELEDARSRGDEERALVRLGKRARSLAAAAGISVKEDPGEAARRLAGRVKRAARAGELTELMGSGAEDEDAPEGALDRLLDYVARAGSGDNTILLHAVSPDREHHALTAIKRAALAADFTVAEEMRPARLRDLGLERALERAVSVDPDVFELLSERGRGSARAYLTELDRLIDTAVGGRVTEEAAARLILDERKEYGSDFVEAVLNRRPVEALGIFERILAGDSFTAFRPFGAKDDGGPAKKGPRGDAAFFPILGLLAADFRRVLAMKCVLTERSLPTGGRRLDYRSFVDRVLPGLKAPRDGTAPVPIEGHPFVLHKAYLAALEWSLPELVDAQRGLAEIDNGVKTGTGSGPELLESFLLSCVRGVPQMVQRGADMGRPARSSRGD